MYLDCLMVLQWFNYLIKISKGQKCWLKVKKGQKSTLSDWVVQGVNQLDFSCSFQKYMIYQHKKSSKVSKGQQRSKINFFQFELGIVSFNLIFHIVFRYVWFSIIIQSHPRSVKVIGSKHQLFQNELEIVAIN